MQSLKTSFTSVDTRAFRTASQCAKLCNFHSLTDVWSDTLTMKRHNAFRTGDKSMESLKSPKSQ
jgi:hypothetical protein